MLYGIRDKNLKAGDLVAVLIPKTDRSYRKAVVRDVAGYRVLVEYDDGRLYCDSYPWGIQSGSRVEFQTRPTKVWRDMTDIFKISM